MSPSKKLPLHFQGKEAIEHVIEARIKGKMASSEIHGAELPGHYVAAADAAKETALLLLILCTLLGEMYEIMVSFLIGWTLWKVGRSAILGYSRLERLHRLIEEERWEIEHHRPQEKEELRALYAAKGFSGKLLDESIEVLMADDNRLLQIMLEEELGLSLESYEHPLKQALGAFLGVVIATAAMALGFILLPWWGFVVSAACVIAVFATMVARLEKNKPLPIAIWNLAAAAIAAATAFFIAQLLIQS